MLAFLGNIGPTEWIVILIIALLLFGSRLPNVARSLGKSINEFKRGMRETADETAEKHPDGTAAPKLSSNSGADASKPSMASPGAEARPDGAGQNKTAG